MPSLHLFFFHYCFKCLIYCWNKHFLPRVYSFTCWHTLSPLPLTHHHLGQTFHEWRDWNCRTWGCRRILIFTEPDNSQCSYFYHPPIENMEATKRNSTAAISCKIALIWDALPPCPLWAAMAVNSWASDPFLNLALLDIWGHHPGHAVLLGRPLRTQVCHTKGGEESLFFSVCVPFLNN